MASENNSYSCEDGGEVESFINTADKFQQFVELPLPRVLWVELYVKVQVISEDRHANLKRLEFRQGAVQCHAKLLLPQN